MKVYIRANDTLDSDAFSPDPNIREEVAYITDSADVLTVLVNDPVPSVRRAAALNPNVTGEDLCSLYIYAYDNHFFRMLDDLDAIFEEIKDDPEKLQQVYSADDDDKYTMSLIGSIHSPVMWEIFYRDPDPAMRDNVASMVGTSGNGDEVIRALADDPDDHVRSSLAFNSNIPEDIIIKLSRDPSWLVRKYIAHNSATPIDIIMELAEDPDEMVRDAARERLDNPSSD